MVTNLTHSYDKLEVQVHAKHQMKLAASMLEDRLKQEFLQSKTFLSNNLGDPDLY